MGLCRHYRLHNHKPLSTRRYNSFKKFGDNIWLYTIINFSFVSKINNNPKYLLLNLYNVFFQIG